MTFIIMAFIIITFIIMTFIIMTFIIMTFGIMILYMCDSKSDSQHKQLSAERCFFINANAECRILFAIMLNVIMNIVVMLNVVAP